MVNDFQGRPFVHLRADFHQPAGVAPYEIVITPKMSFGTGHHPTTFLMIQVMSGIDFKQKTVVDFGTGTGVLAILAEKLGAASVLAIDNDVWSIENAGENLIANNCQNITVQKASTPIGNHDILLANINLNIILENLSSMKSATAVMVLSGLLVSDMVAIREALSANNIQINNHIQKDGWLCVIANMDK
jgi:ribosomal protein L11 methyltransferase